MNEMQIGARLRAAMFVTFLPVSAALMQGQDSVLLLALLAAAAVTLDRGRELTAGVLVGLGYSSFRLRCRSHCCS